MLYLIRYDLGLKNYNIKLYRYLICILSGNLPDCLHTFCIQNLEDSLNLILTRKTLSDNRFSNSPLALIQHTTFFYIFLLQVFVIIYMFLCCCKYTYWDLMIKKKSFFSRENKYIYGENMQQKILRAQKSTCDASDRIVNLNTQ